MSKVVTFQRQARAQAVAALGGKCSVCKEADPRALNIQSRERGLKDYLMPWTIRYRDAAENPEKYRLICASCAAKARRSR